MCYSRCATSRSVNVRHRVFGAARLIPLVCITFGAAVVFGGEMITKDTDMQAIFFLDKYAIETLRLVFRKIPVGFLNLLNSPEPETHEIPFGLVGELCAAGLQDYGKTECPCLLDSFLLRSNEGFLADGDAVR